MKRRESERDKETEIDKRAERARVKDKKRKK